MLESEITVSICYVKKKKREYYYKLNPITDNK